MASGITGTSPDLVRGAYDNLLWANGITPTAKWVSEVSLSEWSRTRDQMFSRWPREVPTLAGFTVDRYVPAADVSTISYTWVENYGQTQMGYRQDVMGHVTVADVERWRLAAEDSRKQPVAKQESGVLGRLFGEAPAKNLPQACADCGLDTLDETDGSYPGVRLCFYCRDLRQVREANAKTIAKYYSRLPWKQRRQFRREMGWKKPRTENNGPK